MLWVFFLDSCLHLENLLVWKIHSPRKSRRGVHTGLPSRNSPPEVKRRENLTCSSAQLDHQLDNSKHHWVSYFRVLSRQNVFRCLAHPSSCQWLIGNKKNVENRLQVPERVLRCCKSLCTWCPGRWWTWCVYWWLGWSRRATFGPTTKSCKRQGVWVSRRNNQPQADTCKLSKLKTYFWNERVLKLETSFGLLFLPICCSILHLHSSKFAPCWTIRYSNNSNVFGSQTKLSACVTVDVVKFYGDVPWKRRTFFVTIDPPKKRWVKHTGLSFFSPTGKFFQKREANVGCVFHAATLHILHLTLDGFEKETQRRNVHFTDAFFGRVRFRRISNLSSVQLQDKPLWSMKPKPQSKICTPWNVKATRDKWTNLGKWVVGLKLIR